MKKSSSLFRLAERFRYKYAGVDAENVRTQVEDSVWTALNNASGNKAVGIMPFVQMAKRDGIFVSFDVTRDDHFTGSPTITVSNLKPGDQEGWHHNDQYAPLVQQVKDYLEKYYEVYPSRRDGVDINYNNFTIHLQFPKSSNSPVAQR